MKAQRRVVNTPHEAAHPLHWTVPFSVGRFWSAAGQPRQEQRCEDSAINLLLSGGYRKHVRGRAVLIDASRVVLYRRGEVYSTERTQPHDVTGFYLRIHPEMVERMTDGASHLPPTPAPLTASLMQGWYRLWQDTCDGLTDDALYERCLAMCLDVLAAQAPPLPATRTVRARVEDVRHHIAAALASSETLDSLAARLDWSRFQLCRHFRGQTGLTVHQYRERLRIGRAVARLQSGERDLTDIALSLGFTSHSHFTARFRRLVGMPPSQLAAQI